VLWRRRVETGPDGLQRVEMELTLCNAGTELSGRSSAKVCAHVKGLILEEKLRAASYWRLGGWKDEDSVRDTGGDRGGSLAIP